MYGSTPLPWQSADVRPTFLCSTMAAKWSSKNAQQLKMSENTMNYEKYHEQRIKEENAQREQSQWDNTYRGRSDYQDPYPNAGRYQSWDENSQKRERPFRVSRGNKHQHTLPMGVRTA